MSLGARAAPTRSLHCGGWGGTLSCRRERGGIWPSRWAFKCKGCREKTMNHAQVPGEDAGMFRLVKLDETQILETVLQILTLRTMFRFSAGESLLRGRELCCWQFRFDCMTPHALPPSRPPCRSQRSNRGPTSSAEDLGGTWALAESRGLLCEGPGVTQNTCKV